MMCFRVLSLVPIMLVCGTLAVGQAAGSDCFTKAEQSAEQIVRHGLRLREGAQACDEPPWNLPTAPLWESIDKQFGPRFAAQTAIRKKAFMREFADDADNRLALWDARIVMHFRHYPVSDEYCAGIKDMLDETLKRGWGAFTKQAAKARDEVRMDYRPCD
jgi:hypothetical protein